MSRALMDFKMLTDGDRVWLRERRQGQLHMLHLCASCMKRAPSASSSSS